MGVTPTCRGTGASYIGGRGSTALKARNDDLQRALASQRQHAKVLLAFHASAGRFVVGLVLRVTRRGTSSEQKLQRRLDVADKRAVSALAELEMYVFVAACWYRFRRGGGVNVTPAARAAACGAWTFMARR